MSLLQFIDLRRFLRTPGGALPQQVDVIDSHAWEVFADIFPGLYIIVNHKYSQFVKFMITPGPSCFVAEHLYVTLSVITQNGICRYSFCTEIETGVRRW
jgi:hypothetical protein